MEDKFVYISEWFDNIASMTKNLQINFYPQSNSVEIVN